MSIELSIRNLTAGYGAQIVLRDLSLDVERGSLTALIGPNGHGKTTLLRAISGLVSISAGQILLADACVDQRRPDAIVASGIIHVPQGDLLFPDMSVLENLRMGCYLPAASRQEKQRLEEVFSLLPKLRDRQQQTASTLSGGERRMVGIGRGLMASGRLLMLDEPSLGLAPILIDQIYDVIDALRRSGRTVILVEENATRAADTADQVHLLDHGQIVWGGTGPELSRRPELFETYLGM